mmetsp:Transcript_71286/g.154888  ORF Transcript_71286/g.154888 Transcript_71286/m.154888 type:complete len:91 (-) Transcript_71286:59-331(-)|eukprot:CAMPEP_0170596170 /NCGR_PEP_ID=MMETSP0224-20130122/14963_1 /TAXON_ID=285029 /ORGANISM="Togula jolla, Strain CCCM 725" /LENGTH=90 /DNA_ID=CAMNT_0010920421 /DNA_START=82 /DNA_END=354 /DNA_ORIENTATION=-
MPLLLLPAGAVQSRRSSWPQIAMASQQDGQEVLLPGTESLAAKPQSRSRLRKSMSVTFGDVDVVCYDSSEPSEPDGCDSNDLTSDVFSSA